MSWRRVFTEILDVFGKPNRKFYDFLGTCATDEKEKAELKHFLEKDGKEDLKGLIGESVTYGELLLRYPSALPQLEYLLEAIPAIKPRLYSIASSMAEVNNTVELCIILNDW
jgi:sulfite reductase (NADPH) flavoprotein alpha-component